MKRETFERTDIIKRFDGRSRESDDSASSDDPNDNVNLMTLVNNQRIFDSVMFGDDETVVPF